MPLMAKILIVEDQNIVALDIQNRLRSLNYIVTGTASSGAGAVKKAEETTPDLVLMDIMLKGDMDGIQAAEEIKYRFGIPVIYLTAYADSNTLKRAKVTEPFGYILKPFQERELHSTIEMALYKHKIEKNVKERENLFSISLKSLDEGIIITDKNINVTFMNPKSQLITKYNYRSKEKLENILKLNLSDKKLNQEYLDELSIKKDLSQVKILGKNNTESYINIKVNKIFDDESELVGYIININQCLNGEIDIENLSSKINNILTTITVNLSMLQDYKDKSSTYYQLISESEDAAFEVSNILKLAVNRE